MRTLTFEILHGSQHRQLRRNSNQHVYMVAVDRPRLDQYLLDPRNLPQQLSVTVAHIATQHLVPILRRPYQNGTYTPKWCANPVCNPQSSNFNLYTPDPSPKGEGFTDPLIGGFKNSCIQTRYVY